MESFLSLSYHHTKKRGILFQKFHRIVRYFRTACPEIHMWKDFLKIRYQFFYKGNIPDIAGKTDHIRLFQINVL